MAPAEGDLRRAAEVLNDGERVAMLIGQGATEAAEKVKEVADILGCGVAKAQRTRRPARRPALPARSACSGPNRATR